jgi:8-oxo-dGTP diphosphatase
MKLQVGVKICLINDKKQILLLKRNVEKYPDVKDPWDIVGGRIDPGQSLIQNLRREIREETGIDYKGDIKLIAAQDILLPDKHVVRLTYIGMIKRGLKVQIDKNEIEKYVWLNRHETLGLGNKLDKYLKFVLIDNPRLF